MFTSFRRLSATPSLVAALRLRRAHRRRRRPRPAGRLTGRIAEHAMTLIMHLAAASLVARPRRLRDTVAASSTSTPRACLVVSARRRPARPAPPRRANRCRSAARRPAHAPPSPRPAPRGPAIARIARPGIEREQLEGIAVLAMPGRRIGRQPALAEERVAPDIAPPASAPSATIAPSASDPASAGSPQTIAWTSGCGAGASASSTSSASARCPPAARPRSAAARRPRHRR